MKKFLDYFDPKTIIYIISTFFLISAAWFGLKEKVNILAADIHHYEKIYSKHEEHFNSLREDFAQMQKSLTRIETMLENHLELDKPNIKR